MADGALDGFRAAGRMLWEAGLVSSHGGNISVRLPAGGLLVTRTGAELGRLSEGGLGAGGGGAAVDERAGGERAGAVAAAGDGEGLGQTVVPPSHQPRPPNMSWNTTLLD